MLNSLTQLQQGTIFEKILDRKSTTGWHNMKWPIGCRRLCLKPWTFPTNLTTSSTCMERLAQAWHIHRGELPAGAEAHRKRRPANSNCSFTIRDGISTATCRTTSRSAARKAWTEIIRRADQGFEAARIAGRKRLVVWGGEFGRGAYSQWVNSHATTTGRDHHPRSFTI